MTTAQYITRLNTLYHTGTATEHSYRGDLQNLIMDLLPDILVTNEPTRVSCGAPDYVLTRKEVPVGYIEAKDVGVDLNSKSLKEQFDRYKAGLSNLIITDYLHFQFFKDGEFITEVSIGEIEGGEIKPLQESFNEFEHLVQNFALKVSQSIKSPNRLAKMMAGKARLMADVIEKSLNDDDAHDRRSNLKNQMVSFKQMLIHDITNKSFADIYAQTIAYGMFAARYHDPTLPTFSRIEAAQLIPKSNPFLRKLFQEVAGYDLDDRLVWIVEELVSIFLASDVAKIMKNFGRATKQEDPVVHFYETFLGEYSPSLRKARGVWYTPQPVVNFIVRAVDDILKEEFNLPQGLADSSKTKVTVKVPTHDKRYSAGMRDYEKEVHRVQILDPATGTGTFLSEVVKHIYKKFEGQQGIWSRYVNENLIPRLNGFELLMASYAMAHLQMDMLLTETGYKPQDDQRFRIFLTNSLEEAHPDTGTLFSSWLSDEADQANAIKRDTPVMVVMGNPPYAVSSTNKGEWIQSLIQDYKKNLNERKVNLDDDYIKFIRYGQHFIDRTGEGVLAYISNNSYIDGLTHRQMRKSLLKTFDEIYILDLHGSTMKNETTINGGKDENVFDIQQGVSLNLMIRNKKKKGEIGKVFHSDLFGLRSEKYNFLLNNDFFSIDWKELKTEEPYYFFVPKDFVNGEEYKEWISLSDLFIVSGSGVKNERDKICQQISDEEIREVVRDFLVLPERDIRTKYKVKDTRDWKINNAKEDLIKHENEDLFLKNLYRPFDLRHTYFTGSTRGFIGTPGTKRMNHLIGRDNFALLTCRQQSTFDFQHVFLSNTIADICALSSQTKETGYVFPLYLYPEHSDQNSFDQPVERTPNLNQEIVDKIAEGINHAFLPDENLVADLEPGIDGSFSPLDVLDYVYAVLHSPAYRKTYKEFLKIDFPRVPYPDNTEKFWQLVELGRELREIHLLESPVVENFITGYPEDGDNKITRKITKTSPGYEPIDDIQGRVWINDQQYFDKVPLKAWEFYIGGYQPAQKWLKDRKERELTFDDILHYQKIIVALAETARIMEEIDEVELVEKHTEESATASAN